MRNHLSLLTIRNLALISDWLDRGNELFVDVNLQQGDRVFQYFIRSLQDLRLVVLQEGTRENFGLSILCDWPRSLRGVADVTLLQQALQEWSDGDYFYVSTFGYFPEQSFHVAQGRSHAVLLEVFARLWGNLIVIGPLHGEEWSGDFLHVSPRLKNSLMIQTREVYGPYDANPARYQWIVDLWQE